MNYSGNIFELNFFEHMLAEEIFDQYVVAGYIYQADDEIVPAMESSVFYLNMELTRASYIDVQAAMSGLGMYRHLDKASSKDDIADVIEYLGIETSKPLEDIQSIKELGWQKISRRYGKKYRFWDTANEMWVKRPDYSKNSQDNFSIMKNGNKKRWLYYIQDNEFQIVLLDDLEAAKDPRSVLRRYSNEKPEPIKISYTIINEVAKIKLSDELPQREQLFFKLYSWPVDGFNDELERIIPRNIFLLFRKVMIRLGHKMTKINRRVLESS